MKFWFGVALLVMVVSVIIAVLIRTMGFRDTVIALVTAIVGAFCLIAGIKLITLS